MNVDLRQRSSTATTLIFGYLNRAVALLDQHYAAREAIDTAMRLGCGLPAGPFEQLELIGPDVVHETLERLYRSTGDTAFRPAFRPGHSVHNGHTSAGEGHGSAVARPVDRIGVLGTGVMARGIAEATATAGFPTVIAGRDRGRAEQAIDRITGSMARAVSRQRLTQSKLDSATGMLEGAAGPTALRDCDLVIEAVVEDLAVKRSLLADLGVVCRPGAVLATTTSSLSVTACAAATGRPADVVGMHFFNPAPVMRLVEVVRTAATGEPALATAHAVCRTLGKTGVECTDRTGFIVNFLLFAYLNRAIKTLERGADVDEIDSAVRLEYGYPMGPFALLDVIGLDVSLAILRQLHHAFPEPDFAPAPRLEQLVAGGNLGRKTGGGFHQAR